jgi:lysozyme family protein
LDIVALECGIVGKSNNWNKSDIDAINRKMDYKKVVGLVTEFYEYFLLGVHIEELPKEAKLAVFSMYVNSPRNCIIAIQEAINDFIKSEHIINVLLLPDGDFGEKTKTALRNIKKLAETNNVYGYLFEAKLIFEMSRIYAKLVAHNPKSNLQYLVGWNNRIDKLLDER